MKERRKEDGEGRSHSANSMGRKQAALEGEEEGGDGEEEEEEEGR